VGAGEARFLCGYCLGTKAVIAAARERGVSRLLHCSTESILFSASSTDRFVAEHTCTTIEEMPGAYTRSKLIAAANPTMPIGNDRNLTPPALMLQYFINRPIQFYLDFIVNLVDVQDVAEGLLLAMQRGRSAQRYVPRGRKPLAEEASSSRRSDKRSQCFSSNSGIRWPCSIDRCSGRVHFQSCNASAPTATVEGVRIALWSKPLSIEKSRRELGYAPRPIRSALEQAISSIIIRQSK
jgi:dihydroflavonol-4-reductase